MTRLALVSLVLIATGASWIDPNATARQASRLYDEGKFTDAGAKYREALVDDPDSALLHYNAGLAAYRDGKYEDAVTALAPLATADGDPRRAARAAYAAGNAKFRLGSAAEAQSPQKALGLYAESLAMYRRAMGADPADADAKVNHEFVEKHVADLKKKLEEQKKQQEQQKQDQQQQPDQQKKDENQQPQDQQQAEDKSQQEQKDQQQQQDQQDGKQQEQQQDQGEPKDQAGDEQKKEQQQQAGQEQKPQDEGQQGGDEQKQNDAQPSGGEGVAGEPRDGQMSPREAEAILDGQRDQEVRPDEIVKQLQGARVAEPREDW